MTSRCADIAVIGMGCRFPGADDYRQFWSNLEQGINSIREITPERWEINGFYSPDINVPNKSISKWCGLLDGIDRFDSRFFNISPREAGNMDPQQRLLLEETWRCIEDSGISLNNLQNKNTSVYVGVMTGDYRQEWASIGTETDSYACLGNVESILANRISHTFNLKGSSISINAACASSLVAVHQAKRSLVSGECDYALAGGVNLNLHPWKYISFSKSRMLSPDGQCKTFDRDANGYVPGDGVGVLLLQRLDDAIAEGSHVYGIIKGSAVNHCGKSLSITAPRVESQRDVILKAYGEAGFSPETVTYVEAHGTGTSLGDPIEIEALTRAFRKYTGKSQYCRIGSVKTNIGHLESSAGVAGIIKVLLMMRHKKVPPTLNMKEQNPIIDFKATPFETAESLTDWKAEREGIPLRAGVSSFGFGGVNCHILLEEYPAGKTKKEHTGDPFNLFTLSAKSPESLKEMIREWDLYTGSKEFSGYDIRDICQTLLTGREHFSFRYGVMIRDKEELKKALQEEFVLAAAEEGKKKRCLRIGDLLSPGSREIKRLISKLPPLKKSFDLILDKVSNKSKTSDLSDFLKALSPQEISFLFTYALAATCVDLGFSPELVAGEGTGIWVSLAVCGIIRPEDVLPVIKGNLPVDNIKLSRPSIPFFDPVNRTVIMPYLIGGDYINNLIKQVSSVNDETALVYIEKAIKLFNSQFTFKNYLGEWDKPLKDSGLNTESLLFDERILDDRPENGKKLILIVAILSALRKLNSRWNLTDSRPEGNHWLDEMADLLNDDVLPKEVAVKLLLDKTVDPNHVAGIINGRQHRLDSQKPYLHIKDHNIYLQELNHFGTWVKDALSAGCEVGDKESFLFLEIGKRACPDCMGVCMDIGKAAGFEGIFKESFLKLWLKGIDVRWDRLYSGIGYSKAALPVYPFSRESHWVQRPSSGPVVQGRHPLIHRNGSTLNEQMYSITLSGNEFYLTDHKVGNLKTLPGAVYLEMALASGIMAKEKKACIIKNMAWTRPLTLALEREAARDVFIGLYPGGDAVDCRIWTLAEGCTRVTHAQGKVVFEDSGADSPPGFINIQALRKRCPDSLMHTDCYGLLRNRGFDYGPSFQAVREFFSCESEGLSRLELPAELKSSFNGFLLHPSLVDGAFQTAVLHIARSGKQGRYLPFSLGEVHMAESLPEECYAQVIRKEMKSGGAVSFDIFVADVSGRVLVKMLDFTMRESGGTFALKEHRSNNLLHTFQDKEENTEPFSDQPSGRVFFQHNWVKTDLGTVYGSSLSGNFLIFDINHETAGGLENILRKSGGLHNIALVKPGLSFGIAGDGVYEIRPGNQDDALRLIEELNSRDFFAEKIVYLCPQNIPPGSNDIKAQTGWGIHSLFPFIKAHLGQRIQKQTTLLYIYPAFEDEVRASHAAVSGFAKSIMLENPKFKCKTIEIKGGESGGAGLPDVILREFQPESLGLEIRYHNGQRLVKQFEEFELNHLPGGSKLLRDKGVYLITGGAGGLGMIFAKYLAGRVKARLVLAGRSPVTDDIKRRIKELEVHGAEVMYIETDVARLNDVKTLVEKARAHWGGIDGIIHCAGVIRDSYLFNKTVEDFEAVLAPKVFGTIYLDEATQKEKLDFFVLFSSFSSVMGNLGQCDYAYANCFMDHFAEERNRRALQGDRAGKTLSINWPLWLDGGMTVDDHARKFMFNTMGISALNSDSGLDVFEKGLAFQGSQLVAVEGNLDRIKSFLNVGQCVGGCNDEGGTSKSEDAGGKDLKEFQKQLLKMAGLILGVREGSVDLDGDMKEFGFDSFSYTDFANKINESYGLDITPAVFFEHTSIRTFTSYLWNDYNETLARFFPPEEVEIMDVRAEKTLFKAAQSDQYFEKTVQSDERRACPEDPVAIIGIDGIMPGSENLEVFWGHIEEGRDLIGEIPGVRWDWKNYYGDPDQEGNKTNVKWGGFMKEVARFDASFFGISPREADLMDPRQRLLLESVWKAIEDAGYRASDLSGTKTGVFVGVAFNDYQELLQGSSARIEAHTSTGTASSILANRISYILNLRGPSEPVDTACSSSLVAIHRGIEAIRNGCCEMVIAGGVNVILSPWVYISFNKAGMLSPDGRCKSFDHRADGYVRGEGVGAVLLKPLSRAVADGDYIYGVIRGSAINHGGRANSMTAPNPNAQAELLIDAYRGAGVDFNTISYIECHGTGTRLGDPVEINGLKKAFNELSSRNSQVIKSCGLGSVKSNVGHLEAAAGIAGLFKVLLSLKYGKIPASINFEKLNPFIDLEDTPFYIVEKTRPWERMKGQDGRDLPRRAGISSFGFGGVNAHLIIEECHGQTYSGEAQYPGQHLILLSAKSEEALNRYAAELLGTFDRKTIGAALELSNIAYTLQVGRVAMSERLAVVVSSAEQLREKLELYCRGNLMVENLFTGSARGASLGMRLLVEGRAGKEFIKAVINDRELSKLGQLWVSGIDIDWSLLYSELKPRRVPLPTYPFAGERHWVNPSLKSGPLLDCREDGPRNLPEDFSQLFYSPAWRHEPLTVNGTDSVSPVGRVNGKKVLVIRPPDCLGLDRALEDVHVGDKVFNVILGSKTAKLSEKSWEVNAEDPHSLDSVISQLEGIGKIYFLGGINNNQIDTDDIRSLDQIQELGVVSLFRLIKSLSRNRLIDGTIIIKVVTGNVHQVFPEDLTNPYSAGLIGLAGAIAREYPQLLVSCIDIDLDPVSLSGQGIRGILEYIAAEPWHPEARAVAYRGGRRYVSIIEPVMLTPAEKLPFRRRGVYFILGGTGGIGLEVSSHLAETVQARLVLVGRSELTRDKKEKILAIEARGGKVLYIKADAADPGSMRVAVQRAKSEFGRIDGVIHSAMVAKDGILENISESDFTAGLSPKIRGSVVLSNAFKNEPLDFMLFFSSVAAFSGSINYGASNYAAGITFKDAFARSINNKAPYPVKVINWGYLGNIGSGAKAGLERMFLSRGVNPVTVSEGMESISRVLGNSIFQVLVIKAQERFLQNLGARLDYKKIICSKIVPSVTGSSLRRALPLLSEADSLCGSKTGFKDLDWYARCLILDSFQRMGVFIHTGEKYEKSRFKEDLKIRSQYNRLFECLMDIFEESGFIEIKDNHIITAGGIDREETKEALQNKDSFRELLLRKFPELEPFINVLRVCGGAYGEIITGRALATDVLFPGSSMELMEGVYKGNLFSGFFNRLAAAGIRSYVEERIPLLQEGEKIKILEVGAGTGGTSDPVLEALKPFEDRILYSYTDVSQAFTRHGKKMYGPRYPFVEFGLMDIERDVTAQGYDPGDYDVIIGANVIHATKRLRNTLQNLKLLLKTNGWLVLNEATGTPAWATIIFGLLDGWWLYEDEERLKGGPLLGLETWKTVLREEGFRNIVALGAQKTVSGELPQHIIVAECDGAPKAAIEIGNDTGGSPEKNDPTDSGDPGAGHTAPPSAGSEKDNLPPDQNQLQKVEGKIVKVAAGVLQLDENLIDPEVPYSDFGVDSIFAAEIVSRVNNLFPVKVKTADFLSHSTLRSFAGFIAGRSGAGDGVISGGGLLNSEGRTRSAPISRSPMAQPAGNGAGNPPYGGPVAIVGMSGAMPGSDSLESFWQGLMEGKSFISEIPAERWSWKYYYGDPVSETNKTDSIWGGFLKDVKRFDAMFFGISPREARLMDPQHRILLETVWKTVEDAGYRASDLAGTKTGVFVGVGTADYAELMRTGGIPADPVAMIGLSPSMLANRISHYYDFRGPSESIDTTCSGSAVAVHRAVNAIRSGECEMAIAGGVSLVLSPTGQISLSKAGILSRSGTVRPFDKKADGFIRGEGAGAVLLKPLARAEEDGDHIYAVIKGSAVNHGGRNNVSLVSPSAEAQSGAIMAAYKSGGIEPGTVNYIESHGTGSVYGDNAELGAYQEAFKIMNGHPGSREQLPGHCGIGSYKPNVGHLEAASGVCAIIKVVFALRDKVLPATLNFEQVHQDIDLSGGPYFIVDRTMEWEPLKRSDGRVVPRRAGIHSFGFGGTNVHIVLEEYLAGTQPPGIPSGIQGPQVLVFSAKTGEALRKHLENMIDFFKKAGGVRLQDVAYTLQAGREAMEERLAIVVNSMKEAVDALGSVLNNKIPENSYRGRVKPNAGVIQEASDTDSMWNKGSPAILASRWVHGADVDWSSLGGSGICKRIPLPTYPFAGERYWFDQIWLNGEHIAQTSADQSGLTEATLANGCHPDGQIKRQLKKMISRLLEMPEDEIDTGENLKKYGFDSLMAVKLSNRISEIYGKTISLKNILMNLTVVDLSRLMSFNSGALTGLESGPGAGVSVADTGVTGCEITQGVKGMEDKLYQFIIDELVAGRITPGKAAELAGNLRKSGWSGN